MEKFAVAEFYKADNAREAAAAGVHGCDRHFCWFGGNKSLVKNVKKGSF